MTDETSDKLLPVTHMEAREAAQRLINLHFRQEPHARVSIPARPDYDDDLRIMRYIEEQEARAPSPGEDGLRAALEWALERLADARNVCYGGVEVEEIEERQALLKRFTPRAPEGEKAAVPDLRDEFEEWAASDHRAIEPEQFEERTPDNYLYYAADSDNHAYIGWCMARRSQPAEARVSVPCSMGVGCDEAGVCYAAAHGDPGQCPRDAQGASASPAPAAVADEARIRAEEAEACALELDRRASLAEQILDEEGAKYYDRAANILRDRRIPTAEAERMAARDSVIEAALARWLAWDAGGPVNPHLKKQFWEKLDNLARLTGTASGDEGGGNGDAS